jgi:hypothetical protein
MFERNPMQVHTRLQLMQAGGDPSDVGITSPPANTVTPAFTIATQNAGGGWVATVAVTRPAAEGTNQSCYLAPGHYPTGLMFSGQFITMYAAGGSNKEVIGEVSQNVSNLSMQAETEHCNDIVHAYDITLGAVQQALTNAAGHHYPAGSQAGAVTQALTALRAGLHARLAALFTNAVDANAGAVDNNRFTNELLALFNQMHQMTQQRDQHGWHTFRPDASGGSWSIPSWTAWWGNEPKDYRAIVPGQQFQVPGPASNVVVHL